MPKRFLRYQKYLSRLLGPSRTKRFPWRGVWLLGLVVLLTSATIAAIIPSRVDTFPKNTQIPLAPPQTMQWGETTIPIVIDSTKQSAADSETITNEPSSHETWIAITIRKGDTLSNILKREGFDGHEISQVIQSYPEARVFRQLRPGQTLRLRTDAGETWQELVYETEPGEAFHIVRRVDRLELTKEIRTFETRIAHVTGTIESSLFEDGLEAGLSDSYILKLAEIFGWDIDFALDLRRGDSFSVIHEEKYWRGQKMAEGAILAAEFINQGKIFRAIAYRDVNGYTTYYTPDGMSVRRPFLRTDRKSVV